MQTCFKSGQIFDEKYDMMLRTTSFNRLREFEKQNKALVGVAFHDSISSQGGVLPPAHHVSGFCSVVQVAPALIRV